jgi:hypothetical protein
LPPADLVINIEPEGSGRMLHISAASPLGNRVASQLTNNS